MGLAAGILQQLDSIGNWGLVATDRDLVVSSWNQWLVQFSKLTAEDAIGRPLMELFPELASRQFDRFYQQALTGQTVILSQGLHRYILPFAPAVDGPGQDRMQQSGRIVPLLEGDAIIGTLTVIEDVTERVEQEAVLTSRARQQAVLAALARSALAGNDIVDLAREAVAHIGDSAGVDFVEVLELQPSGHLWNTLAGTGWTEPVWPSFDPSAAPRLLPALDSDIVFVAEDIATEPRFANDAYLQSHGVISGLVVRVSGPKQRPLGLLGAYTRTKRQFAVDEVQFVQALADVLGVAAERKRLERELQLRAQELADADHRKDEFLAMLAHELRNPLAPVRTALQVLRMKCSAIPLVDQLGEMMTRQIGHLTRLVDDLLDMSRITRGKINLRKEPTDLAAIVTQTIETIRPLIEIRQHELISELPPGPICIDADPTRLVQILDNLLNNAAKYTEPGGRIWLNVTCQENEATISIRDTGIGMPPEVLPHIFDLFTQDDRTLDRAEGGIGIGLTLVRSLVELHGGSVTARSEGRGQGSEFIVRLPTLDAAQLKTAATVLDDPSVHKRVRRILVVDDNVDSADSLAMLLNIAGHTVWTAYDGPSAIQTASAHEPDTVLLDIGLPRMDGYEVARRLRQNPDRREALLIAMTGYGQEDDRRKAIEAGFDLHMVKPLDALELSRVLARPANPSFTF